MPEFYMKITRKYFSRIFFGGGGGVANVCARPSPTAMPINILRYSNTYSIDIRSEIHVLHLAPTPPQRVRILPGKKTLKKARSKGGIHSLYWRYVSVNRKL